MNIIIVGGGRLAYFLTRTFTSKGYEVTIITRNKNEGEWLSRKVRATVVLGDGSEPEILREAGAGHADAVLAITPHDEDNLVICQTADRYFGIQRNLAMVHDPDNEEIFKKLGISDVFSTTRILSSLIEQRTGFEEITNLIPVGEGKINVTEVILNRSSPVVGHTMLDLELPENAHIVKIMRYGRPLEPGGDTVFRGGDRLILITMPDNHQEVLSKITGEEG